MATKPTYQGGTQKEKQQIRENEASKSHVPNKYLEDKTTEELREVEINDLPDKEFKLMVLKMFKELKINWMNRVEKLKVFNKELNNKLDQRDLDHREAKQTFHSK